MRAALWRSSTRHDQAELLDLGAGTQDDVEASLRDLWRINRYLGGVGALTHHLYPRLRAFSGAATVVDIGAGSAEIATMIAGWSQRRRFAHRIIALDLAGRHLDVAQRRAGAESVQFVQADALNLPFPPGRVDYFISSLFLHHFAPEQVVAMLRQTFSRARRGIIMSDVERGVLPLLAFKVVQPIFARSYITRYDGEVSVRRAYTPSEFRELAFEAGLTNVRVHRHPLWRMTLTADKS